MPTQRRCGIMVYCNCLSWQEIYDMPLYKGLTYRPDLRSKDCKFSFHCHFFIFALRFTNMVLFSNSLVLLIETFFLG